MEIIDPVDPIHVEHIEHFAGLDLPMEFHNLTTYGFTTTLILAWLAMLLLAAANLVRGVAYPLQPIKKNVIKRHANNTYPPR